MVDELDCDRFLYAAMRAKLDKLENTCNKMADKINTEQLLYSVMRAPTITMCESIDEPVTQITVSATTDTSAEQSDDVDYNSLAGVAMDGSLDSNFKFDWKYLNDDGEGGYNDTAFSAHVELAHAHVEPAHAHIDTAHAHVDTGPTDAVNTENGVVGVKRPRMQAILTREGQYENLRLCYQQWDRTNHWFNGDKVNWSCYLAKMKTGDYVIVPNSKYDRHIKRHHVVSQQRSR
jgi:hypothetical protein